MSQMQKRSRRLVSCAGVLLVAFSIIAACTHTIPRFGVGGRYEEGRDQFFRGRGGDMDKAVAALEHVVSQDPTYKDSLTYLGRAYYRKGRYQDAYAILQRALVVNKEDEIAWIALGLTQLRLGQNAQGFEVLKGGITLASRVMVEKYQDHEFWDSRGTVRAAIRRSAFLLTKGIDEKDNVIQSTERLLALVDDELNFQKNVQFQNMRRHTGG
jgi:tetratricopeptide (TPR) repeat protein